MRTMFLISLLCVLCACDTVAGDTTKLFFVINSADLRESDKLAIRSLYQNKASTLRLVINGYADFTGSDQYNLELSSKRAQIVRNHLLATGIPKNAIKICLGRGEVQRAEGANQPLASDRRVDIIMVSPEEFESIEPGTPTQHADIPSLSYKTIPIGETFILNNLLFYSNRHTPLETSLHVLDALLTAMKDNPQLAIKIEGHVCCIPISVDNEGRTKKKDAIDFDVSRTVIIDEAVKHRQVYYRNALSASRAKYIYDFLVGKGIDKTRLAYEGFGNSRPLKGALNDEISRRVEIRIIKK